MMLISNSNLLHKRFKWWGINIVALTICLALVASTQSKAPAEEIITDIVAWKHPVKEVLKTNKIKITKVKLLHNKKYPVFYVELPYDPQSSETTSYFYQLYAEILEANSWWSYALHSERDQVQIEINWDRTKKEMTVNIVPLHTSNSE
ncbi:MAG: hypothetical protein OEX19_13170 [Gammaproteobacteria bacterium]|nr:hypothetical protein [Gammaproteobacteria bacterium]